MNTITVSKKKSWASREINAIITIIARDITLTFKSPGTIIMSLIIPVIMLGFLGETLSQNMAGGLGFDYGQFMLIGTIVMVLIMNTCMGMSSLVDDDETNFTQEMMVSPVSRYSITIGKILGSSFRGFAGMICTLLVGLVLGFTLPWDRLLLVVILSPLMCVSAGAIAMIIIGLVSRKTADMALMLIALPQMFLSGAIIPISNSSGIPFVLSRCMPMTYCLDLVRAVVYRGTPEYSMVLFNPVINFIGIVAFSIVLLLVGTFFFVRAEVSR
jgi:ABC-2 type transport system permease protein